MRRMVEEFESSGLRRREFCQQRGIPITTFDYWRREHAVSGGNKRAAAHGGGESGQRGTGAALHAGSGQRTAHRKLVAIRRGELARLIRIAESA